ncbi:MAG: TrmB family transcriptional regulator [Nanoarchaeota archaeon]|nr:TrmB family transcriptional regulator [Nanoarchaeota archaeon]
MAKLKDFGLNSYESKVWAALLSRGVSTAGELSDIANVPRSRSYDVLESLEKKGFVVMKIGKPIKYIAVPPTEVIERVKKRIQKDAVEEEKILEELKDSEILNELTALHSQGIETQDPSELTGSIRGRDNITDHLEYQIKQAKESVVLVTTEQGLGRKTESLLKQIKKAKERGVKVTIAAPLSDKTRKSEDTFSGIATMKDTKKNARYCIVDGTHVTMMLTNDADVHPSYDLAVWMQSPYLAKNLLSSF